MRNRNVRIIVEGKDRAGKFLDPRLCRVARAANDLLAGPSADIGFLHSTLCQNFLPTRRLPEETRVWECTNGNSALQIEAGSAFDPRTQKWREMPLPNGSRARLALIHLSTEAIKQQSPVIKPNRSMTAFLKKVLNREPNGQDVSEFKYQLSALGTATIRMASSGRQSQGHIVSDFDLMWLSLAKTRVLWSAEFVLSREYWATLQKQAVPIDLKAVTAVSHSPLAMDIYLWLTQRLHRLKRPYTVYWPVLWRQFGRGYARLRDFRRKFICTLSTVKLIYPNARVSESLDAQGKSRGLILKHSPPPIPYNAKLSTDV
ncbi:replication protein RepA [Kiloniella majae]|uniref:replication protein RepA n=1 Tax=Kiloniella majae TaxID=1938558 RepID=UPI000A278CE2|nr:replication protein RepA [Kiloniella majae]